MPNRIIKESITTSDTINGLSWEAECFWYRLIVNCDDYGRMDGRTSVLLARCFPLRLGRVKESNIKAWINELVAGDFVFLYKNGHEYLQLKSWDKHQQVRAKRSKFPAYDETCHQMISDDIGLHADDSICHRNPIQSESNPNTNPPKEYDYFSDFWKEYPRKIAKPDAVKAFAKINVDDALMEKVMDGLFRAIASEAWKKDGGQFIPYPATWLNKRRWEDE